MTDGNQYKKKAKPVFFKNRIILPALALLIVGAIVACCLFLFVFKGQSSGLLYIQDGELHFAEKPKADHQLVTDELWGIGKISTSRVATATRVSKDGKYIFFPIETDGTEYFKLCYRELGKSKGETVKIDDDVAQYRLVNGGKKLYYLTDDGDLYVHNLKERVRTAYNVSSFKIDDEGNNLLFITSHGDLYLRTNGKEELLSEDVSSYFCCDDFGFLYYIVDRELFVKEKGKKAVKIDKGVVQIIKGYKTGEVYYYKTYDAQIDAADFIVDDTHLSKPSSLYTQLTESPLEIRTTGLFFYDGHEAETVINNVDNSYTPVVAEESPVLAIKAVDYNNSLKIGLSKLKNLELAKEMILEEIADTEPTYFYVVEDDKYSANNSKKATFAIDDQGKNIYYISVKYSRAALHHVKVNGSKVGVDKEIDSSVYEEFLMLTSDSKPIYFKALDSGYKSGNLLIDGQLVAKNASTANCFVNEKNGTFVFYTNYVNEKNMGTLKVTDGKTIATIEKEVVSVTVTPSGNLLYLASTGSDSDMYLFNDKKSFFIEYDVDGILTLYDWNEPAHINWK